MMKRMVAFETWEEVPDDIAQLWISIGERTPKISLTVWEQEEFIDLVKDGCEFKVGFETHIKEEIDTWLHENV